MKPLISKQAHDCFLQLTDVAPKRYLSDLDDLSSKLISNSHSWTKPDSHHTPGKMAQRFFHKKFSQVSQIESANLKLALMARLALLAPDIAESRNLPDSILAYYPAAFDRFSEALSKAAKEPLDEIDKVVNRIGFVLAISIPCGAQTFDLHSSIPLSSAVLSVYRERSPRSLLRYLRCKGLGIWFRAHTDTEYLEEFNEAGRDKFFLRIAEMLRSRRIVRGLVGTSWYYDPRILDISPRLSYLQKRPLERGAFLMRHGESESDIEFATKTSNTRRRLYKEGKYLPVSYSLIWGRNELVSWANRT